MKFKLIRCASMVLAVACVFLLACPAFAEEVNYRDYETNVTVDGDRDLVTVDFPTEWVGGLVAVGNGTGIKRWFGSTLDWEVNVPSSAYQFYVAPFGTTFGAYNTAYNGRYLSLKNIPTDAVFQINFSFSATSKIDTFQWTNVMERAYTVTDNYASMYVYNTYPLTDTGDQSYTLSMQISPQAGDGWLPQYLFHLKSSGENFEGDRIRVSVDQFRMTVSISSLYRLQEQSGITNELLTEVNRQLAEQGKTMEDILHGTPEQNEAADNAAGILGDKGEQLGGLVDDIQTEKPNLDSVDVDKIIPSAGINSLSAAISPIAENPLVIKILVMVGTLLLVSYVLFGKKG